MDRRFLTSMLAKDNISPLGTIVTDTILHLAAHRPSLPTSNPCTCRWKKVLKTSVNHGYDHHHNHFSGMFLCGSLLLECFVGAIQVLHNGMGGGRVSIFQKKSVT